MLTVMTAWDIMLTEKLIVGFPTALFILSCLTKKTGKSDLLKNHCLKLIFKPARRCFKNTPFLLWQYGFWGIAFFFAGHISADLAWYSFIAGAVDRGRRLLTDRLYRRLIGLCAVFLIGFAGYFAYAGLVKLKDLLS